MTIWFRASRRKYLGAFLSFLSAAALSSIANAQTGPVKGDGATIRLLVVPSGTQTLPPSVIQKFELDKKYGFKLEVVPVLDVNSSVAAIRGGSAEATMYDWPTIARLRQANVGVTGVAPFLAYANGVVVPTASPIKDVADVKGKKLGVTGRGGMDWMIESAAAKRVYGFDLSDSNEIHDAAVTLLRGALEQGQIDASLMYNSMSPEMIASGKFRMAYTTKQLAAKLGLPPAPNLIYVFADDFIKSHPDDVRAFVKAYEDSVDILKTNDEIWVEQAKTLEISDPALKIFRDEVRDDIFRSFTPDTLSTFQKAFDILIGTAGPDVLGMSHLPEDIITLQFQ